jgi:anti-anti-sigma regulatory factor
MAKKRSRPTAPSEPSAAAPPVASATIDLGTSCTLHDVAALRETLLVALAAGHSPVIDGSKVERVDTAGVQVLVGFTIDCMERSLHFTWAGRSEALRQSIRLLGVEPLLESPGVAAMPTGGAA